MEQFVNINSLEDLNEEQGFDWLKVKELFFLCLSKWYLFVISVIVVLFCAYLYVARTQPLWTRTAQVEIKDDKAGKSISNKASGITDIGLFNTTSTVDNEKYMFMSPDIMMEVVKRLKLQDNYSRQGRFRNFVLYGDDLPIQIVFPDAKPEDAYSLKLKLSGDEYEISKIRKNRDIYDDVLIGKIGQTIKTPAGKLVVNPTLNYNGDTVTINYVHGGITNTTSMYLGTVAVSIADKQADVITLSLSDVSPQRAEDILSTLIQVYNERWVTDKNQATLATLDFIRDKLIALENDLSGVDQTISEYKSKNMLPDIESAAQMYMQKNQDVQNKVLELSSQLEMGNYISDFLRKSNKFALIPSGTGLNSNAIEAQIKEYNDLALQRQNIINTSSVNSTLLPNIEQQIQTIKQSIQKGLENQTLALKTQITQLRNNERLTQSQIQATPKQAKVLLSVERQQQVKQSLYMFLLQKREENELSCAFTAYNTRIVMNPYGSLNPSSPRRGMIWLVAFAIGLFIPLVYIWLKKAMTTTVQDKEELKKVVTMPLIAEIPDATKNHSFFAKIKSILSKSNNDNEPLVVVEKSNRNVLNEAFRLLRTNFEFVSKGHNYQIIAITSYNINSGKTFITMNTGITFAIQRKKVLLMDCDIRKASLSRYINSPRNGITDFLAKNVTNYHDVIQPYKDYENLYIMPVGTIPPNPIELISSPDFAQLLDDLRKEYDYIFIDCPPLDIVADTHIISEHVDQNFFIVRAGVMQRSLLNSLEEITKDGKLKNPVMIFNGVSSNGIYGYGKRYGYGKGYGYGYGYYSDGE